MANPYISTALELHTYVKSPETRYKSRPILGTLGLSIQKKDARWIFSFRHAGLRYHGSIGTYPQVSFKEAKSIFFKKRFAITEGNAPPRRIRKPRTSSTTDGTATTIDSSAQSRTNAQQPTVQAIAPTFNDVKAQYFHYRYDKLIEAGSNKLPQKAVARMENLFEQYAAGVIGNLPINKITNSDIIKILSPIDGDASRQKTKAVVAIFLQWLVVQGMLDPDKLNIRWDTINKSLPAITKISKNYPRLAIEDVPRFVAYALRPRTSFKDNLICTSLVLLLLTGQRSGQIFSPDTTPVGDNLLKFCHWRDIDLQKRIWTVPAEYMKISTHKGHALPAFRIPISKETAWCLNHVKSLWSELGVTLTDSNYLVPQYNDPSYPQKASALRHTLEKVVHQEALAETGRGFFDPEQPGKVATLHGFRSCFADWASNQGFSESLVEKALAHTLPKVQRAYQRDDLLEARRPMMEAWGEYCFSQVPFKI